MEVGESAIYLKPLLSLDYGTIGVITSLFENWAVITYPQNSLYEDDGFGGFKLIKGKPIKVYCHSANISDIKII